MILLRKVQSINFSLQIECEIDLYNPFKSTFKAKMEHISPLLREKIGFRSRISYQQPILYNSCSYPQVISIYPQKHTALP